MTTIFANVRPESKYFDGQAQDQPFPVQFVPDIGGYHWSGGIGGQYRTADLYFFMEVKVRGEVELMRFEVVNPSDLNELELTKLSVLKGVGRDWGSYYWEKVIKVLNAILRQARKEHKAQLAREQEGRENDRW
ncbi:hypothetical protein [Endozoicomonas sp. GU-1]|uniref:hypothetical protein n=1 Tax=Endozoicomonas sp. GU-1 TaxID=3009078 RepID=UPI0022B39B17|nr:hypothetical protein [Endozoicomonas sp. GU-1]WBA86505.1 hypothetical protein O3276_00140 [Endozoicomonas sp. GU-1]